MLVANIIKQTPKWRIDMIFWFHKYPYVAQVDLRDCGVAALSMVMKKYGSSISLAHLRDISGTDIEGTTAYGILEASKQMGFETNAIKADMDLFNEPDIAYPFIAHMRNNSGLQHYVVVYGAHRNKLIIADPDPRIGIEKMDKAEFANTWSGVALFIAPSPRYKPKKEKKNGLLSLMPLLFHNKSLIINIAVATFLVSLINVFGSYYLQGIIDQYVPEQEHTTLTIISLGLLIAYIFQQIFSFSRELLMAVLGQRLSIDVLLAYIKHIFVLPMSFFSTRRTGEITSRFSDANAITTVLSNVVIGILLDSSTVIIVGLFLCLQNVKLFFLSLAALPFYILIVFIFSPKFDKMNNDVMQSNSMVSSSIIENINGIETIKSLAAEESRYKKIDHEFVVFLKKTLAYLRAEAVQNSLKTSIQLITGVCVLWQGAELAMSGDISVGQLVTFNMLLTYFTNPLLNILNMQSKIQSGEVANKRLNEVFLVNSEFNDKRKPIKGLDFSKSDIEITNLTYSYGYSEPVIDNLNLKIKKQSKVAIIGTSGSGKSTLAKLLVNFYKPTSGTITVGGIKLDGINLSQLRRNIHYLPQDPYIFSGSVLDNLTLGTAGNLTKDEIIEAVEVACIRTEIDNLPDSYQTQLMTDGTALSGGQKQRIALARAILSKAPIIIFDEATSNLDITTEDAILNNLMRLNNRTIIFIAHHLTVAKRAECIYVLENGKIVESGSHKDLLKENGYYAAMIRTEAGEEND